MEDAYGIRPPQHLPVCGGGGETNGLLKITRLAPIALLIQFCGMDNQEPQHATIHGDGVSWGYRIPLS